MKTAAVPDAGGAERAAAEPDVERRQAHGHATHGVGAPAAPHDGMRHALQAAASSPRQLAQRHSIARAFGPAARRSGSAQGEQGDGPALKAQSNKPIQRKVAYEGSKVANPGDFTKSGTWGALAQELTEVVREYMAKQDQEVLKANPELERAAKAVLAENAGVGMINAVYRLRAGDRDYGTFDLADEQHLMLLIYELARSLDFKGLQERVGQHSETDDEEYKAKVQKENQDEIVDHAKLHERREEERKEHFAKSPKPGLTFRLAVLGHGAAASYYLEANRTSIDPIQTVVIGEANPWGGKRGLQGAQDEEMHVNHPMHMISPERSKPGTDDESLAPRREFARVVQEEISKIVRFVWDSKVISVRKDDSGFYEIDTALLGKCYAQHVVVALGTGPHIEAKEKAMINESLDDLEGAQGVPRVMNLDEFQQKASKIRPPGRDVDIFISGGNAAIDAVTRIVRENEKGGARFKLIWAMGSRGAQFLTGTDNEETKAKYDDHLKAPNMGFRGRTGDLAVSDESVSVTVTRVDEEASAIALESNPKAEPVMKRESEQIKADYYVHGIGQDVGPLLDVFLDKKNDRGEREKFVNGLDPTVDPNFNFGPEPDLDLEELGPEEYEKQLNEFRKKKQAISGYEKRSKGEDDKLYDTGSSLSFIGATASKIAGMRRESERHDSNIGVLPQDMIGNEQLAPIRSSQESQSGMVPSYVGKDLNFSVDNKTVVRLHIALKYPKIPPEDADMWAEIIVGQRRPSDDLIERHPELVGPIPNPVPDGDVRETAETYTAAFKSILQEENDKQ